MRSMHVAVWFAVVSIVLLPRLALSDTVGLLNEFNAGETARASEVNDNFDAVESAVDGNDALITGHEARIVDLENDVGVPGPEGPEGPQGIQGPQGEPGADGVDGTDGADGADGVGVGSSPNTAFVTSETFDGNLGGIAGADAKCQDAADMAELGGTWKAWIANFNDDLSSPSATYSFSALGYETFDGRFMGGRGFDPFPASLLSALDIDENGQAVAAEVRAWTGVSSNGLASTLTLNCLDWTSNTLGDIGTVGLVAGSFGDWTDAGNSGCSVPIRLYCFEQ